MPLPSLAALPLEKAAGSAVSARVTRPASDEERAALAALLPPGVEIVGRPRTNMRFCISVVVHVLCWILVFIHATKPPMQGNAIPKSCCTSMNYEKILGYSNTLILIFIAVIVKQRFTKKSMDIKVGALIICVGLIILI